MRRRSIATWLLLAGVVGCGPVTSPPTPPAPEPSASPIEPSHAPTQPTPSATTRPDTTRIEFVASRQARFPDVQGFTFSTAVGEPFDVTAIADKPGLAWSLESDTPGLAEFTTTATDDGRTTTARLAFLRPGLARLRATLSGHSAYVEVAGFDVASVSRPLIDAIPPTAVFDSIRLITTQADWQAFWSASLRTHRERSRESPPPVDFTRRSVVVVGGSVMDRSWGHGTVTHTSGRDIHVAFPHMSEYMVMSLLPPPIPSTVLQEIPKMPQDARFVFSGASTLLIPPPNNEVVSLTPLPSPTPPSPQAP